MHVTEREKLNAAFESFLDTGVYRDVERELRDLIHAAFVAGWCAAQQPVNRLNETAPPR